MSSVAVFWKGTTEAPHQSALIGYNCGFVPVQDWDVTARDGCQGPQLLTGAWFLVCVRLLQLALAGEALRVPGFPARRQPGWAFSLQAFNVTALK